MIKKFLDIVAILVVSIYLCSCGTKDENIVKTLETVEVKYTTQKMMI